MFGRAVTVWVAILILASINGAVRDLLLTPRLGDTLARALSTIVLSVVVLSVTWFTVAWIHLRTQPDALLVGLLWVTLTLAFDLFAGHYLFHKPWSTLLADYDLRRGRIWILVLIITFAAPLWLGRMRGIVVGH